MTKKEEFSPPKSLVEEVEVPHKDYKKMSLVELKAEAKKKGIVGYSSMTKVKLIEKLTK